MADYADFAQRLIGIARPLYANEPFGVDLNDTVYALDATTIDLSLSVFPWAPFRSTKAAVKLHTLLDLRGDIPTFIHISDGKLHEVNILDPLTPEPGAFYLSIAAIFDFARLYRLPPGRQLLRHPGQVEGLRFKRRYSHPVDPQHRGCLRSDRRARGVLLQAGLSEPRCVAFVVKDKTGKTHHLS